MKGCEVTERITIGIQNTPKMNTWLQTDHVPTVHAEDFFLHK